MHFLTPLVEREEEEIGGHPFAGNAWGLARVGTGTVAHRAVAFDLADAGAAGLPMLEPLLLRIVPSLSILPMLEPLLLRMVPSLSNLPTLEPLLLRMVPLLSIFPQLKPLLL